MKKILWAAVVLCAAVAARAEDGAKREFPADGIKAIQIGTESGAIEVRSGTKIEVEVVNNDAPDRCLLTLEAKDGKLLLKAENVKRWFFGLVLGSGCDAGFRVSAPAALPLDAKSGSGKIHAIGRVGDVLLKVGSGDIAVDDVSGKADLSTGSGNISGTVSGRLTAKVGSGGLKLQGLASGADVESGSGGVRLAWAKAPAGEVDVKSGSGDVRLAFPAGTKVDADMISGSGDAVNKLGETPGAPLKVAVKIGSGDATIAAVDE